MHLIITITDKDGKPLVAVTIKRPGSDSEGVADIINLLAQHINECADEAEVDS